MSVLEDNPGSFVFRNALLPESAMQVLVALPWQQPALHCQRGRNHVQRRSLHGGLERGLGSR